MWHQEAPKSRPLLLASCVVGHRHLLPQVQKGFPTPGPGESAALGWHSQRVQQTRLWEAFPVGKCPLSLRPRTSEGLASSPRQGPQVAVGKEGPQHSLPHRQGAGPLLPPPQPRRPDPVALSYLVQQELSLSATRGVTQGPAPAGQPPRGWRGDELLSRGAPRERSVQPALPGEAGWQESNSVVTGGPSACLVPHGSPFAEALRSVLWRFTELPQGQGLCRPRGHQRDHGFPSLAHCRALPSALAAAPAHAHTCRQESKDAVPVARGHEG